MKLLLFFNYRGATHRFAFPDRGLKPMATFRPSLRQEETLAIHYRLKSVKEQEVQPR